MVNYVTQRIYERKKPPGPPPPNPPMPPPCSKAA
jgi:hypothetical protein